MRQITRIFILPHSPIFNIEKVSLFDQFNSNFSSLLYSILYKNILEIVNSLKENFSVYPLFDWKDDGLIADDLVPGNILPNVKIISPEYFIIEKVIGDISFQNSISLFIYADTIGYTPETLNKMIRLLSNEDEVLTFASDSEKRVTHFGFNGRLGKEIEISNLMNDESILKSAISDDRLIYRIEGTMPIRNFSDFRILYNLLSQKEYFHLCSLDIHKKLNDLFIEFKDKL